MKRHLSIFLLIAILICALSGCSQPKDDGKISIVCTLFPQYDWVKSIVGDSDRISVTLIIQNGTDPHSYQPTAADVMTISDCDMIVYIDGDSDLWVKEALERAKNADTLKVPLSKIEGMTLHEISSHSHSHGDEHHEEEHHHGAFDEHLWLSLSNAATATRYLTEAICALDPEGAELYRKNSAAYLGALTALDGQFRSTVEQIPAEDRFVLFADRFPFVYLLSDYGVEYAAAFEGCTTDVDASFDTVLGLIKEADTHGVSHIAITETSDGALAQTVAGSAKRDIEIIVMNSLQSVNRVRLSEGISYLGVMRGNLTALSRALGVKGE